MKKRLATLTAICVMIIIGDNLCFSAERLGFKGIKLGATTSEINDLINNSEWYSVHGDIGKDKRTEYASLSAEKSKIGCEGEGDNKKCFYTQVVGLSFFNGKLMQFTIPSYEYPVNKIDLEVKRWCSFAYKGLTDKYGPPLKTYTKIADANIFSFKDGYISFLSDWKKGNDGIRLAVGQSGYNYRCQIIFEDIAAKEAYDKIQSKRSSEF